MTRLTPVLLATAVVALAACQADPTRSGPFQPYRLNIPQGNYVDQQMLSQVKPGMTREQVRFVLGSPLLTDVFHPQRWDYVFRFLYASGEADLRRVTVHFDGDRVARVEADPLPARDDPTIRSSPSARRDDSVGGRFR
jgi:outer membrane protein assembly factor BamE